MIVEATWVGIGHDHGDGLAIRGPEREGKSAAGIFGDVARGENCFVGARRIRENKIRFSFSRVVASKSYLFAVWREGGGAINMFREFARRSAQGGDLIKRWMILCKIHSLEIINEVSSRAE